MTHENWQRLQTLFHAALLRPADERQRFLDAACADDESLLQEVRDLLTVASDSDLTLRWAVCHGARRIIGR